MKIHFILLFLLSSCSSVNYFKNQSNKRDLASVQEETCTNIINHFKLMGDFKVYNKYKSYAELNDAATFTKRERELLTSINRWAEIGGRKNSMAQVRHNGAFSKVRQAFEIDSTFSIGRQFKSLFYDVESSYFIARKSYREAEFINGLLKMIKNKDTVDDQIIKKVELYFEKSKILKGQLAKSIGNLEKIKKRKLEKLLVKELAQLNESMLDHAYLLQMGLDEYQVVRKYIDTQGEKGEKVLNKLSLQDLFSRCSLCGEVENLRRPNLKELTQFTSGLNIVRIKYLERELIIEKWVTIVSRLPSQYVYQSIDRIIQKIPWINESKFRRWIRHTFIDYKDKFRYFPKIDRLIYSDADPKKLAYVLKDFYAVDGDDLLITMARRADAGETWKKVYLWLKENLPEDEREQLYVLYNKMDRAWDESLKRGPLPEWHHPNRAQGTRLLIDLMMYAGGLYSSYYYVVDTVEVVEDLTGIDLVKKQAILDEVDAFLEEENKKFNQVE